MFSDEDKQRARQPEEHFVETGRRRRWPVRKIISLLAVVIVVFTAGVAVGRGNFDFFGTKSVPINSSFSNQLNYSSVNQVYKILKTDFDGTLNQGQLIDGLKAGLVGATGDPYTEYFNPQQAKDFNNELSGSITGIGAELGSDNQNNIVIISPLDGYPAQKAGLKPKDIVAAINGKPTQGMTIDEAVNKIRGDEGTKVTLTVVRGAAKPFNVTITRQKITIPSVKHSIINGDIGYLQITQFTSDTGDLAQKAAQDFKDKRVKAVILDLRGDPGGYLDAAVKVSSLWLKQGQTVVSQRRGSTIISTEYAEGGNILGGLPTVVLIDGGSASASEITSGALHDNGDATLVGVTSFGKGSVQQVVNLSDGSELKVTIAHWYTPDGININKKGINPDVTVKISDQQAAASQDPQKAKAIQILQAKI